MPPFQGLVGATYIVTQGCAVPAYPALMYYGPSGLRALYIGRLDPLADVSQPFRPGVFIHRQNSDHDFIVNVLTRC